MDSCAQMAIYQSRHSQREMYLIKSELITTEHRIVSGTTLLFVLLVSSMSLYWYFD